MTAAPVKEKEADPVVVEETKSSKAEEKNVVKIEVPVPVVEEPLKVEVARALASALDHHYDDEEEDDEDDYEHYDDGSYPPKPRNFLEAALYFSTVTLGTVAMANQLEPVDFFAAPLFTAFTREDFDSFFDSRKKLAQLGGWEYDSVKYLQRRISALFAVALSQSSPTLRPYASSSASVTGPAASALNRTNYLKRSIGFFAVSLVDHLPSGMSSRLFQRGGDLDANGRALGLDDLRVPSPEVLGAYWLGLSKEERLRLVRDEAAGLAKGWVNARKTWCMCKYCKHRRLRLNDIFEHVYRAYHDELFDLEARLQGLEPPVKTPHQLKVRRLLYRALAVVAEDILNTRSRLMLEAVNRLGRAFHPDSCRHRPAHRRDKKAHRCHCPDCDLYYDGVDEDARPGDQAAADDDYYTEDDEEYDEDEYSDYDDLDIEEDGDFYEDFNYGEDDAYIQAEGDTAVDEAQLPSTLPAFYDMDLMWTNGSGNSARARQGGSEPTDGQVLFDALIAQIFQFHLVPAYLEHQALEKQRELIQEEEDAERARAEKDTLKLQAKKDKKERQKAARAAQKQAQDEAEERARREREAVEARARAEEEALLRAEAKKAAAAAAKAQKEAARVAAKQKAEAVASAPRVPVLPPRDKTVFAVEDILEETTPSPYPAAAAAENGGAKLSKSARRKKKKALAATVNGTETQSTVGTAREEDDLFLAPPMDLPPGLFAAPPMARLDAMLPSPSALLDPPPPYTIFAAGGGAGDGMDDEDSGLLEPLEPLEAMTRDQQPEDVSASSDLTGFLPFGLPPYMEAEGAPPPGFGGCSRFESLFRSHAAPPAADASATRAPPPMDLFDRPPFNRRRFPSEPQTEDPVYRLATAEDPVYTRPPPPPAAPLSPPGLEGFNPFEDWAPMRSSLFATPLFTGPAASSTNAGTGTAQDSSRSGTGGPGSIGSRRPQ